MMIHVTEDDVKMTDETRKWIYVDKDDVCRLREDAPIEVKQFYEKMKKKYEALRFH